MTRDDIMNILEMRFHKEMVDIYKKAKAECDYNATYFLQMVTKYGGVETARRLLATQVPSEGFTKLWEYGRLDLTMEALVLKPEYTTLFSEGETRIARERLEQYK